MIEAALAQASALAERYQLKHHCANALGACALGVWALWTFGLGGSAMLFLLARCAEWNPHK